MEIRILREEELANAAGLSRYVFDTCLRNRMDFPQTIGFVESYVSVENLTRLHREQKLTVWGAFEMQQLVAVSALQSDGMITMLYVLPQFSGRKMGKNLLFAMREYAKEVYGFEKVVLNATPAWTAFYFSNQGFSYTNPDKNVRVPFVPMYAMSNSIESQKKSSISGKLVAIATFACLGIATLATCIYMITYIF